MGVAAVVAAAALVTVGGDGPVGLMHALNDALLAGNSATLTLEAWCARRGLAEPAHVIAVRDRSREHQATLEVRRHLSVGAGETLGYRRVRLTCGSVVMSEADNWYVPSRLTADMIRILDTTDTAFGRVILPLAPHRVTLGVEWLWSPSVPVTAPGPEQPLFRHRALVEDPKGRPLAFVEETYLGGSLGGTEAP
jgi:hypothetical protein